MTAGKGRRFLIYTQHDSLGMTFQPGVPEEYIEEICTDCLDVMMSNDTHHGFVEEGPGYKEAHAEEVDDTSAKEAREAVRLWKLEERTLKQLRTTVAKQAKVIEKLKAQLEVLRKKSR